MISKEPGQTNYGFFRVIGGQLILVVSDEDIRDYENKEEE